ncbi:MAG: CYTH domain-containing protein [Bacteroidales bacterium]|nr:CYTH domain-containing protein [Bacteroidales bacterium]
MEIERKYLVATLPADIDAYPHTDIEQAYLCTSPTLRIRRAGEAYILTVKQRLQPQGDASSAIVNREEEFSLSSEAYATLKAKCEGCMVSKTRYQIPLAGGLTAELDLFHGAHEGLQLVEVEFPSLSEADHFQPPAWFGQDVSADPRYRNSWLAHNTH